eukprot:g3919.t1
MIAHFHAKAINAMNGGELHSVFTRRLDAAEALTGEYGGKPFSDLHEFLADPELDIVTIATPSGAHFEPVLASLNAGKHVICEKPLEITTERIDRLITAAERNGKTLSAILNRRFHPGMDAFKDAADRGRFGKLTSASAYVKWFRDQAYYDSAAWRGTWALDGGGALMNQSIHTVDALIYLAGPIKSVQASTACLAHERIEVEDIVVATVEFESGALGVIECSTCSWSENGHPARVQLAGTDGSVFMADESFEIWDFRESTDADRKIRETLMKGQEAGLGANDPTSINFYQHQRNFEEVVKSIHEKRECATSASEARKAVAVIEAIYQSAKNGGAKTRVFLVLGGLSLSATAQSFSSAITFDEALQDYGHGDIVDPDAYGTMLYYSPRITVTPPTSSLTKAVIFDTEDPQTIANTSDPDLIPNTKGNVKTQDLGNVIIIQENNGFTTTGDSINNPYKKVDDDAKGGTITFDFNPDAGVTIDSLRLTFLDLEKQGDISFVFSDGTVSKTIAGTNIEGETAIVYGDGNANETRFYTASELGLTSINQLQT